MSRKSKSKDQTKALNIPFTLTQGDLLQEALGVSAVDWLFLFVSCFLIGSLSWLLNG
jgi:hypothetical protein